MLYTLQSMYPIHGLAARLPQPWVFHRAQTPYSHKAQRLFERDVLTPLQCFIDAQWFIYTELTGRHVNIFIIFASFAIIINI